MDSTCCSLLVEAFTKGPDENIYALIVGFLKDIGPLIVSIGALCFGFYQFRKGQESAETSLEANRKLTELTLESQKLEAERREVYKKLNEFYGPFQQLRKRSKELYEIFRLHYKQEDKDFRTLSYLLDKKHFKGNDQILLGQIISIGQECNELIMTKAGLIDDEKLREELLPMASAHFFIIKQAFDGTLVGEKERFLDHVFPTEIDDRITDKINSLQKDLRKLDVKLNKGL